MPGNPWCSASDTIECTGEENVCIFKVQTTREPVEFSSSIYGCATKSMCDENYSVREIGYEADLFISCTS
ncbi:hypothetical protein GDO86_006870 [Hymenochirus boettgeri]|uniref:Uncharacterized protein n=1 Tax=Hymenochirus boettgeri TaxID=247094 RepID=A0A8T2JDC4_9PIPI|nr:hypothetical protein GDO86_006870 [Hymenochirus boettgeri]